MPERVMRFPADLDFVASARDFAAHAADEFGATVDRDDLALVAGELVANAAEHQTDDAELLVRVHPDGAVDIEVLDRSPTLPNATAPEPSGANGHLGLVLVDAISDSWGILPEGTGKRVWARLASNR